MNLLSVILTILSSIVILLAIIFEGKLKVSGHNTINHITFINELKKVSLFGWILILLTLALNFGNSLLSVNEKIAQQIQFEEDTIKYSKIITKLENQRIQDSLRIVELKSEIIINGLKSDSIRVQVTDNAIKALEEQRLILERKRENAYIQMVSEVEDNLRKIYISYREQHIRGFQDTSLFISTRLKNEKINEYIDISSELTIIEHLLETSESIDAVNNYAELVLASKAKSDDKKLSINMFLKNVASTEQYLLAIYKRTIGLNSYKQYESLDFSKELPKINENQIKLMLQIDYLIKTTDLKIMAQ